MKLFFLLSIYFSATSLAAQQWQQIGSFNRPPLTFFADSIDNLLYIGGHFKWNDTTTLNGICSWNGAVFSPLGQGVYDICGNVDCGPVSMILRFKGEIYVGAPIDEIGGIPAYGIARWNGLEWSPVGDGLYLDSQSKPTAVGGCVQGDSLFVSGIFRSVNGDTCNSVAYWNGSEWIGLDFPPEINPHHVPFNYRILFYKEELYVGGNSYNLIEGNVNIDIARYKDNQWKQVGGGLHGGESAILDMVVFQDELYVCGYFRSIDGNAGNKIMRWDGEQWKDVGGGLCSPSDIATDMMVHEDKLYVVGIFDCVGDGLPARDIAVWDGERWCSFGNSYIDNKINAITAWNGDIYIGGGFTQIDGQPVQYFAKWIGDHATDTCSAPVSAVTELQAGAGLKLYPNPAGETLRLELTGLSAAGPAQVVIVNALGQPVWSQAEKPGGQATSWSIPTTNWPAGTYSVHVRTAAGPGAARRFVKK